MTIGQTLVVALPIGLSVLGISLLGELTQTVERISLENHEAIRAAQELNRAMLLYEIGRTEGSAKVLETETQRFTRSLATLRELVRSEHENALLRTIEEDAGAFFDGERHLRDMLAVVSTLIDLQEDAIAEGSTRCREAGRSGVGLMALLGALSVAMALYFGYWLTRHVGYPFERILRGLEDIAGGDLQRRINAPPAIPILDRLARLLNSLADRLQRLESDENTGRLVLAVATEALLDRDGRAALLVTLGNRVVLANGGGRALLDEGPLDASGLPSETQDRMELRDAEGEPVGSILWGPRKASAPDDSRPSSP
jgi:hypothetical protein